MQKSPSRVRKGLTCVCWIEGDVTRNRRKGEEEEGGGNVKCGKKPQYFMSERTEEERRRGGGVTKQHFSPTGLEKGRR